MTLKELQSRIRFKKIGYGHFSVTDTEADTYCVTTNTLAIDRINSDDDIPEKAVRCGYTLRGAYMALYSEIRKKGAKTAVLRTIF